MTRNSAVVHTLYTARAKHRADFRVIAMIQRREDELRWSSVYADDCIWPTGPLGHAMFEEGMTVAGYLGPPRYPMERLRAIEQLCCCMRAGTIIIRRHRPAQLASYTAERYSA